MVGTSKADGGLEGWVWHTKAGGEYACVLEGVKIAEILSTYFMNGPLPAASVVWSVHLRQTPQTHTTDVSPSCRMQKALLKQNN